ncbi:molybdopterin synthase catalytic subunit [Canna indica]|uniref:Molybdopterin synthase catalytic subunit n=1 Tax=Canna indica TaxID=4628 RepID=A0AAQ3QMZ2_9LILI|nr:molybdopterin synthase catalytic subunit [Canna indica]
MPGSRSRRGRPGDRDNHRQKSPMSSVAAVETVPAGEEKKDLVEVVEASSGPINLTRYVDFVRDPAAGAIATFEGTTRDTFEGKRVVELRYEAYVPMAARRLAAICAEARAAWQLLRLAVVHRLGTVGVGEASVFVAASAVHRAEAMEACRYIIDEVKASVPIWKKEVYENGEVWKENREFHDRRGEAAAAQIDGLRRSAHDKKAGGCCGSKIRVDEPVIDSNGGEASTV